MDWRGTVGKEYTSLSDSKVKAAVQMEGFVCFVFTVHLKVSGKKMKSILSVLNSLRMQERLH